MAALATNPFYYLTAPHEELEKNDVIIQHELLPGNLVDAELLGSRSGEILKIPDTILEQITDKILIDSDYVEVRDRFCVQIVRHNDLKLLDCAITNLNIKSDTCFSSRNTLFHIAAAEKMVDVLLHLYNTMPQFDRCTTNNESLSVLHYAVLSEDMDVFNVVLKDFNLLLRNCISGELLEIKTKENSCTALHLACKIGFHFAIEKLIEDNANCFVQDKNGNTPLHLAACLKDEKSVAAMKLTIMNQTGGVTKWSELLLIKNSDLRIPIMFAENQKIIALLLEHANLSTRISDEHGPILHWACGNNKPKLLEEILKRKVSLDKTNHKAFTPLKIACKRGYDEISEMLLEKGADPDYIGKSVGFTALNNASQYGHLSTVKLLIKYGASIAKSSMVNTALNSAVYGGQAKITRYLLSEHSVDPNIVNRAGKTPMFQGINEGHPDCVKVLIEFGADVNSVIDPAGNMRPIHLAVRMERRQILKLLLDNGAKPDEVTDKGVTALMLTAEKDCGSFIPLLMSHGITLTKVDDDKNTLIHYIAKNSAIRCAEYIMQRISKLSGVTQQYQIYQNKNNDKKTPFDIACEVQHEGVLSVFIKYVSDDLFDNRPKILHALYDKKMDTTLIAVLNSFVEADNVGDDGLVNANVKILDSNGQGEKGQYPVDRLYNHMAPSLLHKIAHSQNPELRYHPLIMATVEKKLFFYRIWYIISFLLYLIFLILLYYALLRASYVCDDMLWDYSNSSDDAGRAFCELVCVIFWLVFSIDQIIEYAIECYQVYFTTCQRLKISKEFTNLQATHSCDSIISQFFNLFSCSVLFKRRRLSLFAIPFSAAINYFSSFNVIDFSSLLFLFIFAIFRIIQSPYQWTFASISLILCTIKLFKYTRIIPALGAYVTSVFRIFVIDIPRFSVIVIIILFAYVGGIHLAARQQIFSTNSAFNFATGNFCINSNTALLWFDSSLTFNYDFRYPLLSGIIFLLNGGPHTTENYLLNVNFLFTFLYLGFSFAIIVVMLNILIAQFVKTYHEIEKTNTLCYKLDLVVKLELKSSIKFFLGYCLQKYISLDEIKFPIAQWKALQNSIKVIDSELQIKEMNKKIEDNMKFLDTEANKAVSNHEWVQENVSEILDYFAKKQNGSTTAKMLVTEFNQPPKSDHNYSRLSDQVSSMDEKLRDLRSELMVQINELQISTFKMMEQLQNDSQKVLELLQNLKPT